MTRLALILACGLVWGHIGRANAQNTGQYDIVEFEGIEGLLVRAPQGPFGLLVFNDDALGVNLGVIYLEGMPAPRDGEWSVHDRVWQDAAWSTDVQNAAWSPDGKRLFVATSQVYGEGGLFELDLHQRHVRQLFPGDDAAAPEFNHARKVRITRLDDDVVEIIVWDWLDEVEQEIFRFDMVR